MSEPATPVILSPAEEAEILRRGNLYSAIALLGGLFCMITLIPFVGLFVIHWAGKRAALYGNPALLSKGVAVLSVLELLVLIMVAIRVLTA